MLPATPRCLGVQGGRAAAGAGTSTTGSALYPPVLLGALPLAQQLVVNRVISPPFGSRHLAHSSASTVGTNPWPCPPRTCACPWSSTCRAPMREAAVSCYSRKCHPPDIACFVFPC